MLIFKDIAIDSLFYGIAICEISVYHKFWHFVSCILLKYLIKWIRCGCRLILKFMMNININEFPVFTISNQFILRKNIILLVILTIFALVTFVYRTTWVFPVNVPALITISKSSSNSRMIKFLIGCWILDDSDLVFLLSTDWPIIVRSIFDCWGSCPTWINSSGLAES